MKRTNVNNQIAQGPSLPFIKEVATGKIYEVTSDCMAQEGQDKVLRIEEVGGSFWTTLPFASIIDGTYSIVSKDEAEAYKTKMEGNKMENKTAVETKNNEGVVNVNYKSMKKEELIALLMEKDATIAAQAARLDKAVVEFKKLRAEKVELEKKLTSVPAGNKPATQNATVTQSAPKANTATNGSADSGVICKICGKQHLTNNVLSYANRMLEGEQVCIGCQRKYKIIAGNNVKEAVAKAIASLKGETPVAPQAPTTNAAGVTIDTLPAELVEKLKAEMLAKMGNNTNIAVNPTNIGF